MSEHNETSNQKAKEEKLNRKTNAESFAAENAAELFFLAENYVKIKRILYFRRTGMDEFREIIGNDLIKDLFLRAVRTSHVSHGYILSGEDGMGKKMIARSFAKLLLCEDPEKGDTPCGKCHSCLQFASGNHPDVIYLKHEKPNVIGVDDIRNLNEDIIIKPYSSAYKIYIVDEAETMTVAAQNALLKTLEEPPIYAVILLLTTNGANFLQTILSRCVILNLKQIPEEEVERVLREQGIPEKRIQPILKLSRGNIGKAKKMAESDDFSELLHEIMNLMQSIHRMTFEELMAAVGRLSEHRLNIRECLDFIRLWYRDVLLFKVTNDINVLVFQESFRDIREVAQKSSFEGIENIMQAIDTATRRLEANVNFELTMELLLMAVRDN